MDSAINWFEIPVKNIEKSKAFYEEVFQLEMENMTVGEMKMAIFPANDLSGALTEEKDYSGPERGTVVYLRIPDNMEAVLERVANSGGTVVTTRSLIDEQIGWWASFRDLDGTMIGIYQSA